MEKINFQSKNVKMNPIAFRCKEKVVKKVAESIVSNPVVAGVFLTGAGAGAVGMAQVNMQNKKAGVESANVVEESNVEQATNETEIETKIEEKFVDKFKDKYDKFVIQKIIEGNYSPDKIEYDENGNIKSISFEYTEMDGGCTKYNYWGRYEFENGKLKRAYFRDHENYDANLIQADMYFDENEVLISDSGRLQDNSSYSMKRKEDGNWEFDGHYIPYKDHNNSKPFDPETMYSPAQIKISKQVDENGNQVENLYEPIYGRLVKQTVRNDKEQYTMIKYSSPTPDKKEYFYKIDKKYDSGERSLRTYDANHSGKILSECEWDSNGNVVKVVDYNYSYSEYGSLRETTINEYRDDGSKITTTSTNDKITTKTFSHPFSDGTTKLVFIDDSRTISFDKDNNPISLIIKDKKKDGSCTETEIYCEGKCDANGNRFIKKEYDKNNNLLNKTCDSSSNMSANIELDENNQYILTIGTTDNITKEIYYKKGNLKETQVIYSNGTEIHYSSDGEVKWEKLPDGTEKKYIGRTVKREKLPDGTEIYYNPTYNIDKKIHLPNGTVEYHNNEGYKSVIMPDGKEMYYLPNGETNDIMSEFTTRFNRVGFDPKKVEEKFLKEHPDLKLKYSYTPTGKMCEYLTKSGTTGNLYAYTLNDSEFNFRIYQNKVTGTYDIYYNKAQDEYSVAYIDNNGNHIREVSENIHPSYSIYRGHPHKFNAKFVNHRPAEFTIKITNEDGSYIVQRQKQKHSYDSTNSYQEEKYDKNGNLISSSEVLSYIPNEKKILVKEYEDGDRCYRSEDIGIMWVSEGYYDFKRQDYNLYEPYFLTVGDLKAKGAKEGDEPNTYILEDKDKNRKTIFHLKGSLDANNSGDNELIETIEIHDFNKNRIYIQENNHGKENAKPKTKIIDMETLKQI